MRCYRKILHISYKDHVTNEEVRAKFQQAIGPLEDLLTIVKRRKLQWYGHVSRSSGLAKTSLQGTVKGGRRQGGQRKRREDNLRKWTGLEFGKSQRAVENREKWIKLVAKSSVVPQRPSRLRDWWWWWCLYVYLAIWHAWGSLLSLRWLSASAAPTLLPWENGLLTCFQRGDVLAKQCLWGIETKVLELIKWWRHTQPNFYLYYQNR